MEECGSGARADREGREGAGSAIEWGALGVSSQSAAALRVPWARLLVVLVGVVILQAAVPLASSQILRVFRPRIP